MNRCRKRDADELPLRHIVDEVCRIVDAGGNDVAFAAIDKVACTAMPSLPTDPPDADTITGSRFASLGDAPFYTATMVTQLIHY